MIRAGAAPTREMIVPGEMPRSNVVDGAATDEDDEQRLGESLPEQEVVLPLLHGFYSSSRGVGLADMCYALINGRRPRCHYDIGLHAIEIIHGIGESCRTGRIYEMTTRCDRPSPIRPSALSETAQEATLDD